MKRIEALNIKKLIKELEYVESNYNYLVEAVHEADVAFIEEINSFVSKNSQIKEKYDNHNNSINTNINSDVALNDNEEVESVEVPKRIKKLYREIVKITHPDKISNKRYNEIYIKATNAYNNLDIVKLYSICDELDIKYELEVEDQNNIKDRISDMINKINLLESTVAWKWFNCNDESIKEKIISLYVNNLVK